MSKQTQMGHILRAAASLSVEGSSLPAVSRDATREEKLDFIVVAKKICPSFHITESMKPLLNDLIRWCLMLKGHYNPEKGLWIWGDVGTGKSTMLEIIRRYCQLKRPPAAYRKDVVERKLREDKWPYGFRITNASFIAGVFAKEGYPGIEPYIVSCRQAFDEVGRECIPTAFYGNTENVFRYILQRRYDLRHGDFTHVTSNLAPEQIGTVYGDHIYDRCFEMFNFVQMSGESWR